MTENKREFSANSLLFTGIELLKAAAISQAGIRNRQSDLRSNNTDSANSETKALQTNHKKEKEPGLRGNRL